MNRVLREARSGGWRVALTVFLLLLLSSTSLADENKICFACHRKTGATGTRGGEEISLYVDRKEYETTVHGNLACTKCHRDVSVEDIPHEDELKLVDCASCHEKQGREHLESRHGEVGEDGKPDRLAPNCVTCHGTHGIRSHRDRESPTYPLGIPLLCGRCHTEGSEVSLNRDITQDKILENYSLSIHGEGL
ncbi:MAG: hypothetical protein ACYS99_23805, partial [Planctomycetota bacterium]